MRRGKRRRRIRLSGRFGMGKNVGSVAALVARRPDPIALGRWVAGAVLAATSLSFPALADVTRPNRGVAACDWYVSLGCFVRMRDAVRRNDEIESGYIIETTRRDFPRFRTGLFCVVKGPSSRAKAEGELAVWRAVVPDTYLKQAGTKARCASGTSNQQP